MRIPFLKMHGLGNDFAVIDQRDQEYELGVERVAAMSDRGTGIGFDQLLVVEKPKQDGVDYYCRIFNADGHEVAQCGNGMRCLVRYIIEQGMADGPDLVLSTSERIMHGHWDGGDLVTVDMGVPLFLPEQIPLLCDESQKTPYSLSYQGETLSFYVANLGNPHAVICVDEHDDDFIRECGHWLSRHEVFPEGVNVGFMRVNTPGYVSLQVYERGSGLTRACGSGACAAAVVGMQAGLLSNSVRVTQLGGDLQVAWAGEGSSVFMTGPAVSVYFGEYLA